MKGSTLSTLISAFMMVLACLLAFRLLRFYGEPTVYLGIAIVGFAACSVYAIVLWIDLYIRKTEEKSLRATRAGIPPKDGTWTAVAGEWRAIEPLVAPICREEVVYYEYEIYTIDRSGEGASSDEIQYEGRGLAPSVLVSRAGLYRLFVVPEIEAQPSSVERAVAVWNATVHAGTTRFTPVAVCDLKKTFVDDEPTDERGRYRVDRAQGEKPIDECEIREWRVPNPQPACIFGYYSESRGGFIARKQSMRRSRLVLNEFDDALEELRSSKVSLIVFASLFTAAAIGILLVYPWWATR